MSSRSPARLGRRATESERLKSGWEALGDLIAASGCSPVAVCHWWLGSERDLIAGGGGVRLGYEDTNQTVAAFRSFNTGLCRRQCLAVGLPLRKVGA